MAEVSKKFSPVRMTANTEDAAVQQALEMVGVTRDDVDVEVLQKTDKGVTVRIVPRGSGSAPAQAEPVAAATAAVAQDEPAPPAPVAEVEEESALRPGEDWEESAPAEAAPAPARQPAPVASAAAVDRSLGLTQDLLERMGLSASVSQGQPPLAEIDADSESGAARLYLDIDGEDVGILIGKHGQTLQSFQYLVNLTLNNAATQQAEPNEPAVRVVVDAGGYRARRAVALAQAAKEGAARAKRDGRAVRLEPMPAHERRLVHLSLRDDTSVSTSSEGREPWRRVVIGPSEGGRPSERGGYGDRNSGRRGRPEQGNQPAYGGQSGYGRRSGGAPTGGGGSGYGRERRGGGR